MPPHLQYVRCPLHERLCGVPVMGAGTEGTKASAASTRQQRCHASRQAARRAVTGGQVKVRRAGLPEPTGDRTHEREVAIPLAASLSSLSSAVSCSMMTDCAAAEAATRYWPTETRSVRPTPTVPAGASQYSDRSSSWVALVGALQSKCARASCTMAEASVGAQAGGLDQERGAPDNSSQKAVQKGADEDPVERYLRVLASRARSIAEHPLLIALRARIATAAARVAASPQYAQLGELLARSWLGA